jgi:hypothetical protein
VDSDKNGKAVRRPAGIDQEHLQRANNLSHEHQEKLRRERRDEIMRKQRNKLVKEKLTVLSLLEGNRLCEETLLELIGGLETTRSLAQAEPEKFNSKKCKFLWSQRLVSRHISPPLILRCSHVAGLVKLLKAFIHARRFTGSSPDRGWKWPSRSKAKEVDRDALADLALERCTWQLKLKEPTVEEVAVQEQVAAALNPAVETLGKANDEPPLSFFLLDRNWIEKVHLRCVGGHLWKRSQ